MLLFIGINLNQVAAETVAKDVAPSHIITSSESNSDLKTVKEKKGKFNFWKKKKAAPSASASKSGSASASEGEKKSNRYAIWKSKNKDANDVTVMMRDYNKQYNPAAIKEGIPHLMSSS